MYFALWLTLALLVALLLLACARRLKRRAQQRRWQPSTKEEQKRAKKLSKVRKQERTWCEKRSAAIKQIAEVGKAFGEARPGKPLVCVSIDVEAWEQDTSKVTEIGLAVVRYCGFESRDNSTPIDGEGPAELFVDSTCFQHRHILIREHLAMRNSEYVHDNREGFLFGDSEVLSLCDATLVISAELAAADYIVGHAMAGDIDWFKSMGVTDLHADSQLATKFVDTQALDMAWELPWDPNRECQQRPQRSLLHLAENYRLDPQRLHNGANDAAFTLWVMLSQCGVPFEATGRGESSHATSAAFLEAQAAADAELSRARAAREAREGALRAQVIEFADRMAARDSSDAEEYAFPPTLSVEDRRCIFTIAQELGLSACSRGAGDKRYISIAVGSQTPKGAAEPRGCRTRRRRPRRRQQGCDAGAGV